MVEKYLKDQVCTILPELAGAVFPRAAYQTAKNDFAAQTSKEITG